MVRKLVTAALAVLVASSAIAERLLERALETSTDAVSLPVSVPSTIEARECPQCPSRRMEVPQTARFFVGDQEVTLKQLRDFSLGKRANMVIFYELNEPVVRRIVVSGRLPAQR